MQKMHLKYAKRLLDGGYAFGNSFLSKTDTMLICLYEDSAYTYGGSAYFVGTKLEDGNLITDEQGYVVFTRVEPVIDETTKWHELP